jgi:hypothetical protein
VEACPVKNLESFITLCCVPCNDHTLKENHILAKDPKTRKELFTAEGKDPSQGLTS